MPKFKLTVTLPDGTTATRTTARTYTHVVAARRSYEYAMSVAAKPSLTDRSNYAHYAEYLDGTSQFLRQAEWRTPEQQAEHNADCIAKAQKIIGAFPTVDAFAADQTAKRIAAVERSKAEGFFDKWTAESWAGRYDLAQKAATLSPWFAETRVIPVD